MKSFSKWIVLQEMPITAFNKVGDWTKPKPNYGFDRKDQAILNSPQAVEKIHKLWSNTHQQFELYFLRTPIAYKFREEGEKTVEWVRENLKFDIDQPPEDKIVIIFTNNIGAEKIPMTAWMIAHRLGHAIERQYAWNEFNEALLREMSHILQDLYHGKGKLDNWGGNKGYGGREDHRTLRIAFERPSEKEFTWLAQAMGSMNSAVNKQLVRPGEFAFELLAQFIRFGKVTFRSLPRKIGNSRNGLWSREDPTEWDDVLRGLENTCDYYLEQALDNLGGKIFVM